MEYNIFLFQEKYIFLKLIKKAVKRSLKRERNT